MPRNSAQEKFFAKKEMKRRTISLRTFLPRHKIGWPIFKCLTLLGLVGLALLDPDLSNTYIKMLLPIFKLLQR